MPHTITRTIKARYVNGTIVPLEPIDGMDEGEEIVLSLEDPVHATEEEEDEALGRAIAEGLGSEPVSRERVFEILCGGG